MDKSIIIYLCGIHSLFFAVFHAFFWKIFRWKKTLTCLDDQNRAIMQVLNLRITYLAFFIGFLCFFYTQQLYQTELGRVSLIGFSLFWLGRTIENFIFFKLNNWIETLFLLLFILGAVLFILPVF